MDERELFRGYGVRPDAAVSDPPRLARDVLGRLQEQGRVGRARPTILERPHITICIGDGERGCLAEIRANRTRCRFCSKTVALRA